MGREKRIMKYKYQNLTRSSGFPFIETKPQMYFHKNLILMLIFWVKQRFEKPGRDRIPARSRNKVQIEIKGGGVEG